MTPEQKAEEWLRKYVNKLLSQARYCAGNFSEGPLYYLESQMIDAYIAGREQGIAECYGEDAE